MDCLQLPHAAEMMRSVLQNSGVEEKALGKAMKQLDITDYFSGKVISVLTFSNYRTIVVGDSSKTVSFSFPVNTQNYEEELIRAQGLDLRVMGSFQVHSEVKTLTALVVESK